MAKVLILFAHPMLEKSLTQVEMIKGLEKLQGVYFHDLYQVYPDFDMDVEFEKTLLLNHDIIIWQHPFYWYGAPAIIKQWIDLVLEHGWAYGKEGNALRGKKIFNAISTGGPQMAYDTDGFNKYTIQQFLAPFERTAHLCKMHYLPPFVIHGTHKASAEEKRLYAEQYRKLLMQLAGNALAFERINTVQYLNDLVPASPANQ